MLLSSQLHLSVLACSQELSLPDIWQKSFRKRPQYQFSSTPNKMIRMMTRSIIQKCIIEQHIYNKDHDNCPQHQRGQSKYLFLFHHQSEINTDERKKVPSDAIHKRKIVTYRPQPCRHNIVDLRRSQEIMFISINKRLASRISMQIE